MVTPRCEPRQRSRTGRSRRLRLVSEFASELRRGIGEAQDASVAAMAAGHPYRAYLHRVRLAELLELAARHDVETAALVQPAVRVALAEDRVALEH